MNETTLTGGCLCGAIRYRLTAPQIDAGYCHCRLCQRAAGAPVVAWATFPFDAFAMERGTPTLFASSPSAERGFCGHCGTPVHFNKRENPQRIDITIASLDDPDAIPLQYHIWMESRRPWLHIADDLARYDDNGPDSLI